MNSKNSRLLQGEIIKERREFTLAELCDTCSVPTEYVIEMVEQGVISPVGRQPANWRFRGVSIRRVRRMQRLRDDLGVNMAGAALAADLLDEIEHLRGRLRQFEIHLE